MVDIIERDLSYIVNGCIFDVHNEVGPGVREECYQKAMEIRLAQAGLSVVAKPHTRRELIYLGEVADIFEPDLLVASTVVVELKAQSEDVPKSHFRQTMNYLKLWQYELGLLVNFWDATADIRRVVFHETSVSAEENLDALSDRISPDVLRTLDVVRETILAVHREVGLGYSDNTYRKLVEIGLKHRGLACESRLVAEPTFRDRRLPTSSISPLRVENSILVQIEAIRNRVSARQICIMQTHLGWMGVTIGIIASFGQSRFELRGVRPHANESKRE